MGLQPTDGLSFSCIAAFTPSLRNRFQQTRRADAHFFFKHRPHVDVPVMIAGG